MDYKLSRYNRYVSLDNGDYYVYNLYSSAQSILSSGEYTGLVNLSDQCNVELYLKLGFIVSASTDEEAVLELERKMSMFQSFKDEIGFVIAPTMDCNARCFYCYESDTRSKHYMEPSTEERLIEYISENLDGKRNLWISWFGGEPLLCSPLIKRTSSALIDICKSKGIEYVFEMTSNGYYGKEYVDLIKECQISEIQITIDGFEDEYRKRKNYVSECIDPWGNVVESVFELSKVALVTIRMNFDRNNVQSLMKATEYLMSDPRWNNKLSLYYYPLEPAIHSSNPQFFCEDEYESIYNNLYTHLYEMGYYEDRPKGLDIRTMTMPCYCASLSMNAVDYNGIIYQCQQLLCRTQYKIGDVWNGISINKEYINWFDGSTPAQCKDCDVMPVCQCGCITKRNLGEEKYLCHIMKYRIACQEKLKANDIQKRQGI